jgi:hypothetical protein
MTFFIGNLMKIVSAFFITLSFLLASCSQEHSEQGVEIQPAKIGTTQVEAKITETWQQVTVKYLDFEGGFFGLVRKDGKKLLPMNLAKNFKVNGSILKVKGHVVEGMMTTQQWGTAFKVTQVELIKLGEKDLGQAF